MIVDNLKALVDGFAAVPHGESALPGQRCLHCVVEAAQKELAAIHSGEAMVATKILDALESMENLSDAAEPTGELYRKARAARAELAAIQRAATALVCVDFDAGNARHAGESTAWNEARALMLALANGSPALVERHSAPGPFSSHAERR